MIEVFRARTRLGAWAAATKFLLAQPRRSALNVILDIAKPTATSSQDRELAKELDRQHRAAEQPPMHSVADTIFPGWEYQRHGLKGVLELYPEEYDLMKPGHPGWGTYAERMIRRRRVDGTIMSPLGSLIEKMRREVKGESGSTFRARYEINLIDAEYDLPLYDTVRDDARRRGIPCLSHLSFKLIDKNVHLCALYRNHDYRYKVPGNLLGLARLQACIAKEAGASVGSLAVVSTLGYIESRRGMSEFRDFVKDL
jgi:hypothetical protein